MSILQLLNNVFGGRGNLRIIVTEFSGTFVDSEQSELRFALHSSHQKRAERAAFRFTLTSHQKRAKRAAFRFILTSYQKRAKRAMFRVTLITLLVQNRFEEQNPILFQFNRDPKSCTGEGEPRSGFIFLSHLQ